MDEMREQGIGYGSKWPVEFFEGKLKEKRGTSAFAFALISIRHSIEVEEGYYIKSAENGQVFEVVDAPLHEDVAASFDHKLRRYAVRSINLRSATLLNPNAQLTDEQRKVMESNLEKASVRLVLISRQTSISKYLAEKNPDMIQRKKKKGDAKE